MGDALSGPGNDDVFKVSIAFSVYLVVKTFFFFLTPGSGKESTRIFYFHAR